MIELLGALIYRIRGMDEQPWFPHPTWQIIFAAPFAWIFYEHWQDAHLEPAVLFSGTIVVWAFTVMAVLTGHGNGIDLGTYEGETEPETVELLIKFLKNNLTPKGYDVVLLSLTGLLVTAPAGLATLNPLLIVWGALKGPAYLIAEYGIGKANRNAKIEAGELLTGAAIWSAI
jgi:hypothetical protein